MRMPAPLLFLPLIAAAAPLPDGQEWAPVPAARGARLPEAIFLPDPLTADVVRIVGPAPDPGAGHEAPRPVFAVDIADVPGGAASTTAAVAEPAIPADALWPDANDRVAVGPAKGGGPPGSAAIRNPWEVRVHPKIPGEETVLACGGIIGGAEAGFVALLNGRVLRRGDTVGGFSVAQVHADEVVLERNGSYVVIPRGRRVTVSTAVR
jgi:hypothetical protein